MSTPSSLEFVPVTDVTVGTILSAGTEVLAVRQTKSRVYITFELIAGGSFEMFQAKGTQIAVQR